jgi:hypothetical protein
MVGMMAMQGRLVFLFPERNPKEDFGFFQHFLRKVWVDGKEGMCQIAGDARRIKDKR